MSGWNFLFASLSFCFKGSFHYNGNPLFYSHGRKYRYLTRKERCFLHFQYQYKTLSYFIPILFQFLIFSKIPPCKNSKLGVNHFIWVQKKHITAEKMITYRQWKNCSFSKNLVSLWNVNSGQDYFKLFMSVEPVLCKSWWVGLLSLLWLFFIY